MKNTPEMWGRLSYLVTEPYSFATPMSKPNVAVMWLTQETWPTDQPSQLTTHTQLEIKRFDSNQTVTTSAIIG